MFDCIFLQKGNYSLQGGRQCNYNAPKEQTKYSEMSQHRTQHLAQSQTEKPHIFYKWGHFINKWQCHKKMGG